MDAHDQAVLDRHDEDADNDDFANALSTLAHDLTGAAARLLPALGTTDGQGDDVMVPAKFFAPWGNWTWYATEYDPSERLCFGLVDGNEVELGYFSLDELATVKGPFGLTIERDLHWTAKPLREVRAKIDARR